MHGKQQVIAPILTRFLGLRVEVAVDIDTDTFGTFSRDIERAGSQIDAARAKIEAAFATRPDVSIALASEGSFGAHPDIPFMALNREVVVLIDRQAGLEVVGRNATSDTNFAHAVVSTVVDGMRFAQRAGFPAHGMIVIGCQNGQPWPDIALMKDATIRCDLESALLHVIARTGSAFIETDMRAHRNPTRMRAIKRATIDLVRAMRRVCPACGSPGYAVVDRVPGLRCSWCDDPTLLTKAEILSCAQCGWRVERSVKLLSADPAYCARCNP